MSGYLKPKLVLAALIACGSVMISNAYAQVDVGSATHTVAGVDCHDEEYVKALLDDTAITSFAAGGQSISIIARPGSGESSRKLTQKRLHIPRQYLVENRGVSNSNITTTEGGRVRGLGHVEVYVGSKLHILFRMKRNRGFAGKGCYP